MIPEFWLQAWLNALIAVCRIWLAGMLVQSVIEIKPKGTK